MGYINNTTLTEAGERLLAKAETGTELKYTRIMVGDGQMTSGQELLTMTTVISPVISVPITFCEPIFEGPTMAKVGGTFDNTQITTTFMYREVGLFALDPDDGEILYAYGNAGTQAEPIAPAADGGLIVERTPIILAIIGRAKNITAAIASGANISNYEFNQYKTETNNLFVNIENTKATIEAPKTVILKPAAGFVNTSVMWYQIDQFRNVILGGAFATLGQAYINPGELITTLPDEAIPLMPKGVTYLEPPVNFYPYQSGFLSGAVRISADGRMIASPTMGNVQLNTLYFGTLSSVSYIGKEQ